MCTTLSLTNSWIYAKKARCEHPIQYKAQIFMQVGAMSDIVLQLLANFFF